LRSWVYDAWENTAEKGRPALVPWG
jgi:hypothetical protein